MNPAGTRRFLAYTLAGALGTGAQYLVLAGLVVSGRLGPVAASALGASAGALVNYLLNHRLVFRSQRPHRQAAARFFGLAVVVVGVNSALMEAGVSLFGMPWLPTQLLASAVVLVLGYAGNARWTFRP